MNAIDRDDGSSSYAGPDASRVVAALEEYQEALRAGRALDRGAFMDAHRDVADRLAEFLDALDLIQSAAGEATTTPRSDVGPSPLGPGEVLGDFRIVREVGRGGMGVVYEVEELSIPARRVALKVLPVTSTLEPRTLQRFRVETQAAACLNHPNIVPVFSAGCDRGIPFYAMPLIRGRSLSEILRTMRECDLPAARRSHLTATGEGAEPPWHVALARLGLQAAEALEHAHALGVIHRDIKPSNLIVDVTGRLWVTDFGLARIACGDAGATSSGDLVGTLRYMPPEQIRGEPGAADPRADIYALGVTLYEAVTLRPLFDTSDRSALIHRILNDEPPAPRSIEPTVPRDLETIILKAMDKIPAGRYSTARALADDLGCFLEDRPIRARRLGIVERSIRWSRRHRPLLATGIAGIILSMAIGTLALWRAMTQAEENLAKVNEARRQESQAFLKSFGINDMVTVPLLHEATVAGIWDQDRRRQSYGLLIGYYDEIATTLAPEHFREQVVAQAARRAGALRLQLADRQGLSDFARAIELYEALSARTPEAVFYRTDLISTLREYASHLEKLGDARAKSARRRACEVAEGLLGDEAAKAQCFRPGVITQFSALIELLSRLPDATASDRALAERLRDWIRENPVPQGYLPRP
jgi:serine/threonine protein kinase